LSLSIQGEPLANFRNVKLAIDRITTELGIGARRITVSTVGIVPNIQKLVDNHDKLPQVKLAVSLHCADDDERTALIPANKRNGGLTALMTVLREYIETTGRRVTFEWALIAGENDDVDTARKLGRLIQKHRLRRDLVHVNVIPLNPTGKYAGKPSQRHTVNAFCSTLEAEFGVSCTPRVRRGIDIEAGCGQLKSSVLEKQKQNKLSLKDFVPRSMPPTVGVHVNEAETAIPEESSVSPSEHTLDDTAVDFDDFDDPTYEPSTTDNKETDRLLSMVQGTTINLRNLERVGDGDDEVGSTK